MSPEAISFASQPTPLRQPLLYQVATAGLSPADIAAPIRSIVGAYRNVTVMLGKVDAVDTGTRAVPAIWELERRKGVGELLSGGIRA
jgi:NADH dehydrogenase FAD-containing subunit